MSETFGGSIELDGLILEIFDDCLYCSLEDGASDPYTDFAIRYEYRGADYVDTMRVYPVDLSTECCYSLSWTEVEYFGKRVASYRRNTDLPGVIVTVR